MLFVFAAWVRFHMMYGSESVRNMGSEQLISYAPGREKTENKTRTVMLNAESLSRPSQRELKISTNQEARR
jgi:hypothetical protein